ncbi:MAG: glycosyltransferase [Rhodospirillales bacterium]|jgi:cellulose synthase/poly-beta-1,6-N-acetylglucosamine synthase-like glycosyltransferase|nr:glycosyltransferase [Rhodospirillales bacterium]
MLPLETFLAWGADAALVLGVIIFGNGVLQNLVYVLQLALSFRALRRRGIPPDTLTAWWRLNEQTMPISLLVPAFGEEETIVESVRSMLALHYPEFEVIVINDGSKDRTLEVLIETYELESIDRAFNESVSHKGIKAVYGSDRHPKLIVIDKDNGGKADALNAGINLARAPLFCVVDADSLLEADSLLRAVQPFLIEPDDVVAVGGSIRLANGSTIRSGRVASIGLPSNMLALFQVVEYLRAFLIARLAWSEMDALMLVSGAFGIFRRSIAIAVGGFSHGTVGEDMEIIVKIHRHLREHNINYGIRYVPDPVCWTEAPESLAVLRRQRTRWQRGALETFFKHIRMLGNPRYGLAGTVGYVYVFSSDVIGPVLEAMGYFLMPLFWYLGILSWEFFLAYMALTFVFGVFISVCSMALEEMELRRMLKPADLVVLTGVAILENFGYRQLNNLWRIQGWWQFLRGTKEWGADAAQGLSATLSETPGNMIPRVVAEIGSGSCVDGYPNRAIHTENTVAVS